MELCPLPKSFPLKTSLLVRVHWIDNSVMSNRGKVCCEKTNHVHYAYSEQQEKHTWSCRISFSEQSSTFRVRAVALVETLEVPQ